MQYRLVAGDKTDPISCDEKVCQYVVAADSYDILTHLLQPRTAADVGGGPYSIHSQDP